MAGQENRCPIVVVEWADAWVDEALRLTPDDAASLEPYYVSTVGYLLHEDEQRVVLAGDYFADGNPRDRQAFYQAVRYIPRGCIIRIRRL